MSSKLSMLGKHMRRPVVAMKVVPGEATDGTGRVCIHLFIADAKGPFIEPHGLHAALDEAGQPIKGQMVALPTRGRLACDAKRQVRPVTRNGITSITARTDEPQAVTCPRCKVSLDYLRLLHEAKQREDARLCPVADTGGG